MSVNIFVMDRRGNKIPKTICLSEKIGKVKADLNEAGAKWKFDGELLKDERTFISYSIEKDDVITTNSFHVGGINNK